MPIWMDGSVPQLDTTLSPSVDPDPSPDTLKPPVIEIAPDATFALRNDRINRINREYFTFHPPIRLIKERKEVI